MKHALLAVGGAAALGLVGVIGANLWVLRSTRGVLFCDVDRVPAGDIGLVLGTSPRMDDGRGNLFFKYRMDAAAELFRACKVRHLLVSGGNPTKHYDESSEMYQALIARGVPAAAITRDYAGYRTLDSIVRAQHIFGAKSVTIVSQPEHARRALFIARRVGLPAVALAARDVGGAGGLKASIREIGARTKAVLDLSVLGTRPRYLGEPEPIRLSAPG